MNKRTLILGLIFATTVSGTLYSQKLSPFTEAMLSKTAAAARVNGMAGQDESDLAGSEIRVFIRYNHPAALDSIRQCGGTVQVQYEGTVTASLPIDQLRRISSLNEIDFVEAGVPVNLLCERVKKEAQVDYIQSGTDLPKAYTGKGVVIGIVDLGLEYNHMAFRDASGEGLRIKRVWNQSSSTGKAPAKYGYGIELSSYDEIVAATCDSGNGFHATHVTNIATGSDPKTKNSGIAPDAEIVFVSFGTNSSDVANAIQYIFEYADEVDKPCVINMSLGSHMGPHDGTSSLDKLIDELTGPGRIIVGAVGNEGESKMHVHKKFTDSDNTVKTMLAYSSDKAKEATALEIWGDTGSNLKVKVGIADPLKGRIVAQSEFFSTETDTQDFASFHYDDCGAECVFFMYTVTNDFNRPNVYIEVNADEMAANRKPCIIIEGEDGHEVNMWNVGAESFTSANRTGWTDGDYDMSAGEIGGTAKRIISVGSFNTRKAVRPYWNPNNIYSFDYITLDEVSPFSSHGPTADGRLKPEVIVGGMIVVSAVSQYDATGGFAPDQSIDRTYDSQGKAYYYAIDAGTSMAAPAVTGSIALWLEAKPDLTPEEALDVIKASSTADKHTGTDIPNNSAGYGKLNAYKGIQYLINGGSSLDAPAVSADDAARVWTEGSVIHCVSPVSGNVGLYTASGTHVASWNAEPGMNAYSTATTPGVYIIHLPDGTSAKIRL